jgi:hypothetical protein
LVLGRASNAQRRLFQQGGAYSVGTGEMTEYALGEFANNGDAT